MDKFDDLLKSFDLDFFGNSGHKISIDKAMELYKNDSACLIDVRSKQETEYVSFPFAKHIPVNEIPNRINEIPKDKTIILFCFSGPRATIVYAYLKYKDYPSVKVLPNKIGEISSFFNTGYVLKNKK